MKKLFDACGRHSRPIHVFSDTAQCMECESEAKCLAFDSSYGEYTTMVFCKKCIDKFFDGHISKGDPCRDLSNQDTLLSYLK